MTTSASKSCACPAVLYFVRLKELKLHNHFGGLIPHGFIIPTTTRTKTIKLKHCVFPMAS
jgi:hypothetical protein